MAITNEDRADRIDRILSTYDEQGETGLTDLQTDILHWCDLNAVACDHADILRIAQMHHADEVAEDKRLRLDNWRTVADVEGWGLFESNRGTHIERDDEQNLFASDLHATMHVVTCAMAHEDGPHMHALTHWREVAPEEWMSTMCGLIGSLPGFNIVDELPKLQELQAASDSLRKSVCSCESPDRVTCGSCSSSWCERCDPAPSAMCHTCNGRGHSLAPLPVAS